MRALRTFQDLFKRYRRPGDLVFALGFFAVSAILLACLPVETTWVKRTQIVAQPAFWPAVAVGGMALFSGLHLIGGLVSERIPGRLQEVIGWLKAVEYALWFMVYVAIVPWIGYLPGTVVFTVALSWRLGYRSARWTLTAALFSVGVVVLFKSLLHVKIPAGELYGLLPPGDLRSFLMTYL